MRFNARENDQAGLYFYRARYYDPLVKRFISEDPIGTTGGQNFYAYVNGNPVVSPSWLYLGYLAGAMPKAQVQDIQLSLAPGWYPILTAESFLGRLILKEGRPRAVFFKAGWPMPWLKNEITVVKFSAGESAQLENGKGMITLSKEYPWGTVHFMQRAHLAYIAPFGVSVSSTYSFDKLQAAVDDIQRISRIHTSP